MLPELVEIGRDGKPGHLLVHVQHLLVCLLGNVTEGAERLTDTLLKGFPRIGDLLLQDVGKFNELLIAEWLALHQGYQGDADGALLYHKARILGHSAYAGDHFVPLTVHPLEHGVPALGIVLALEGLVEGGPHLADETFHGLLELAALARRERYGIGPGRVLEVVDIAPIRRCGSAGGELADKI